MIWWRIRLTEDGEVKDCAQVEAADQGDARVIYVQGETADQAVDAAIGRYRRAQALRNTYENRRNRARQRKGLCRNCPKKLAPDSKKFCAKHRDKAREYMRSYMQTYNATGPIGRPEAAPKPPKRQRLDPVIAEQRREQRHRLYCALQVQLGVLLEKFDELDPNRPYSRFREWLLLEMAARTGQQPRNDVQAAE